MRHCGHPCVWAALLAATVAWGAAAGVRAQVERFAVIVGSNRGQPDEQALRYAHSDARKVHDTLRDIGAFPPFNMVLLESPDADTFRRTLIDVNDRLRGLRSRTATQVALFVYYSGHADSQDLHLGQTRLAVAELSQLVRGSAADFRLLVLDACRSGVLTRAKGGHIIALFAIPERIELSGEGLAFLTASADDESAQESDELRGSFFTHAFVSGLLGAADRDRDGNVVLDEAYQYAYDNTLRASSRSASGLQHPTFFYDLHGQGQLVLTRPFAERVHRGVLNIPQDATYLVFRDSLDGQVAAEVSAEEPVRSLSLASGAYFLRGRTASHMLEGLVRVAPGRVTAVDPDALTRIEYAHLVRKGHAGLSQSHAVELLASARSPLPNGEAPCLGARAGYRLDTAHLALLLRGGLCTGAAHRHGLGVRTWQYDLGLRALHALDLSASLALEAGVGLGGLYFGQHFRTRGRAPARRSWGGQGELVVGATLELGQGAYATVSVALQTYLFPMLDAGSGESQVRPAVAIQSALGAGLRL